jgi:enterochelin esterase family protein
MQPVPFVRQLLGSLLSRRRLIKRSYLMPSVHLNREVMVDLYRPAVPPWRLLRLAVFNDGQDLPRMDMFNRLQEQYKNQTLSPTLVVGIHAEDRLAEYGTAKRKDYLGRGAQAAAYQAFILEELIPWLDRRHNIFHARTYRAIAGFSLGGLNAFDLAWNNPFAFGAAGVFSGSLWWRHQAFNPKKPDAGRIVHDYVRKAKKAPPVRFWFMAGTDDEKEDRNKNGIIDVIDDTLQLMALLEEKGLQEQTDFEYLEVEGGEHNPETWGRVVMDFLHWL